MNIQFFQRIRTDLEPVDPSIVQTVREYLDEQALQGYTDGIISNTNEENFVQGRNISWYDKESALAYKDLIESRIDGSGRLLSILIRDKITAETIFYKVYNTV